MQVTRRSPVTGQTNTLEVNVTEQQMQEFQSEGRQRLVQEIFCDASAEEREFILTGYTPEDWAMIFGGLDDEAVEIGQGPRDVVYGDNKE